MKVNTLAALKVEGLRLIAHCDVCRHDAQLDLDALIATLGGG